MNFGIVPETLVERVGLWLGRVPVPLVDLVCGPLKARMVMAAVNLGLFEALRERPRTASDLADALSLDREALDLLLRALAHLHYLERQQGCYGLSALARRTMLAGAPMELTAYARWNETQWRFLDELEAMVRTGRGVDFHGALEDCGAWENYQRAMLELARLDSEILTRLVPIASGATRLLDLGGAHGFLGAALCRSHPPLRSTVIDLPPAIEHGRRLAFEGGYAELVAYRAGDLRVESFEECDVALLSNVLHHFSPSQIVSVLGRVRAALRREGTLAIWELEAPRGESAAANGLLAGLFFRLASTGNTYLGEEYEEWLASVGFSGTRVVRPRWSPDRVLVLART
jgi:hypothetical protein